MAGVIISSLLIRGFAKKITKNTFAATKQREQAKKRRKAIFGIQFANVAVYAGVFLLLVSMIYLGYDQPKELNTNNANAIEAIGIAEKPSVDDVVAANIAAGLAKTANLPITASVSNMAISVETMALMSTSDSLTVIKPQLVESVVESRLVESYTVVAGDTVPLLSTRFGVSSQTIKWANDLTTDALTVGSVLKILPIDGVLYTVKNSDTFESIAKKYKVDQTRVVTYNDLEVSGLVVNTNIILPEGDLPEEERPGYVAPVVYSQSYGVGFSGNTWFIQYGTGACPTYAFGNCTCYVYARRIELGLPVGAHWGNASTWDDFAIQQGLLVDNTPSIGAIIQNHGGLGHVGIVESIAENGDITISEMNARVFGGGYNIVSGRTILAGNVSQFNYIH